MQDNLSASCYLDAPSPTYDRHLFEFEKNTDYWGWYFWFVNNWKLSFYFIAIYLLCVFGVKEWMKSRRPFQLRAVLFVWNLSLATYSICATFRVVPETIGYLRVHGLLDSLCLIGSQQHKQAMAIWMFLFAGSKVVELGDTMFIVLRKNPLIFLHVFHHVTVLFFVWSSSAYPSAMQAYFMVMNVFVHSFMYSYYALKVLKVPIPKACSIAMTLLQLLQMVMGIALIVLSCIAMARNVDCCVYEQALVIAIVNYSSYFMLFLNYFMKAYVSKKPIQVVMGLGKKRQ